MKEQNELMVGQQWSESLQQWVVMQSADKSFPVSGDMLVLSMTLMGAFVLMAVLTDSNIDDDDDFGGGMMIPAHNPI